MNIGAAHISQHICPAATHQKTSFAADDTSPLHFTQDIKDPINALCAKNITDIIRMPNHVTLTMALNISIKLALYEFFMDIAYHTTCCHIKGYPIR